VEGFITVSTGHTLKQRGKKFVIRGGGKGETAAAAAASVHKLIQCAA
jgi:hypothetical protein